MNDAEGAAPRAKRHPLHRCGDCPTAFIDTVRVVLRVYLVCLGTLLLVVGISLQLIAFGSLSILGNANPLTEFIPDWPNSWVLAIVGGFIVGGAALFCSIGCSGRESRWCSSATLICNAAFIFIGSVVIAGMVLGGTQLLSPDAWNAVRGGAVNAASGLPASNGTDSFIEFVGDVLSPEFVRPFTILLMVLLFVALLAETFLLCRKDARRPEELREVQLRDGDEPPSTVAKSFNSRSMKSKKAPPPSTPSAHPPASEEPNAQLVRNSEAQVMGAEV